MSPKLYELAAEYRHLESLDLDGDIPAEAIRNTLDCLQGDLHEKCTNVALFSRNLAAVADSIEAAAAKMLDRAKSIRKRSESIEQYLLLNMQLCGISKIESPYFTLAVRKNPPAVVIDHEGSIPDKFWRQPDQPPLPPKVVDKKAIAAAIKAGEEVPGAHSNNAERLVIST